MRTTIKDMIARKAFDEKEYFLKIDMTAEKIAELKEKKKQKIRDREMKRIRARMANKKNQESAMWLRENREKAGMTQRALDAALGLKKSTTGKMESFRKDVDRSIFEEFFKKQIPIEQERRKKAAEESDWLYFNRNYYGLSFDKLAAASGIDRERIRRLEKGIGVVPKAKFEKVFARYAEREIQPREEWQAIARECKKRRCMLRLTLEFVAKSVGCSATHLCAFENWRDRFADVNKLKKFYDIAEQMKGIGEE